LEFLGFFGKPVYEFFSLPVVTNATAGGLKDLVLEEFRKADIPLKNIVRLCI
jgi:hypothetical protein